MKFLIVEDEHNIYKIIKKYLEQDDNTVLWADSGTRGIELFISEKPDFVILDLMLPGADGFEVCRVIREHSNTVPIIMLTAKWEVNWRIEGLKIGADDYIPKPFSPRELMARIEAILRRSGRSLAVTEHKEGLIIDERSMSVFVEDKVVEFTLSEYKILKTLYDNPNKVFTREELINIVKGEDAFIVDRGIDVHMANIRKKIAGVSKESKYIKTVWGVGYKL